MAQRLIAEINLDNILFNYRQVLKCAPDCRVCCVVKANAYGHGAVPVARVLAQAGADFFAVATPEEALQLRRHGISQDILLLCPADADWVEVLAAQRISLTVGSIETARIYAKAAKGAQLKIHIKLDTGMTRLGLPYQGAVENILAIARWPNFIIDGLFTHFSVADEDTIIIAKDGKRREGLFAPSSTKDKGDNDFTNVQLSRFQTINKELRTHNIDIPLVHCACSAALIAYPHSQGTMVRPGIMLYGSNPLGNHPLTLKPALTLKARVAQVSRILKGESVGYGRNWFATRDSVIATVSLGYADGLTRLLSGKLPMLIHGREARQVGRICMDMCMLDITEIPQVVAGDYVTIIGRQQTLAITADQIAQAAGTITHEVLCAIGLRVPRLYYQSGQLVEQINYLDQL